LDDLCGIGVAKWTTSQRNNGKLNEDTIEDLDSFVAEVGREEAIRRLSEAISFWVGCEGVTMPEGWEPDPPEYDD
jgi:hypothetical protein